MNIVLLAHNLRSGGGAVGGKNFINALKTAAPEHTYRVFVPPAVGFEDIALPSGSDYVFCKTASMPERFKFDYFVLPKMVKAFAPDAILGLGNFGMPNPPAPQAMLAQGGRRVKPAAARRATPWRWRQGAVGCALYGSDGLGYDPGGRSSPAQSKWSDGGSGWSTCMSR